MVGSGQIEELKPFPVGFAPSSSIIDVIYSANSPNADPNEELKKSRALGLAERRPGGFCLWWLHVLQFLDYSLADFKLGFEDT